MIVYSGTKATFMRDAINGVIAGRLDGLFTTLGIGRESYAEYNSWRNSLPQMALIVGNNKIDDNVQVALEYQIPLTSKRVDFMVGGSDGTRDNVVIVELKQWDKCQATSRENVVIAYTGNANREVAHPSQQAYSYAKLIENFNESVRENNIGLFPCAYLHNYLSRYKNEICHSKYTEAIKDAPVFLQTDGENFRNILLSMSANHRIKNSLRLLRTGN